MPLRPIRLRRARRTDFETVRALLAASGLALAVDDRGVRSRFRRLVADLGADLYVATVDDRLCGVVHVTYARHLIAGPQATLELLVVAPEARRQGIGRALAEGAAHRAHRRHCVRLTGRRLPAEAAAFFAHLGWRTAGEQLEFDLPAAAD